MTDERDALDDLGLASCPRCGEPMDLRGDVREVDRGDGTLAAEGSAWWRCPRDGAVRLV